MLCSQNGVTAAEFVKPIAISCYVEEVLQRGCSLDQKIFQKWSLWATADYLQGNVIGVLG
jgi:hypothetical protein